MKRKVALITIRNELKNMYYNELNSIFYDYLDIIPYSLEIDHKYQTDKNCLRSADVILLTNANIIASIKHLIREDCEIVYLSCAFLKNKIESLKSFPANTNALVCFSFQEISNQAAKTIYEMGIINLNLSVYSFELTTLDKDYDIAIVGENSAIVPEKISTIYSLGKRKVSFTTLMNLAVITNILDDRLNNRILEYAKELALPRTFVNRIYSNASNPYIHLQAIFNTIDNAIIVLNSCYKIINYNKSLVSMFSISSDLLNKQITDLSEFDAISEQIVKNKNIENLLIEIKKNKNVMLSIQKVDNVFDYDDTYIVSMRDVTDTIKLQNTLKKQLEERGHTTKHSFSNIYGKSKEIRECINKAKIIAKHDKTVLIIGESGTGKELFAQSIHNDSSRKNFSFVSINCAALPSTLLESELFGYEEGTFTGAIKGGKMGLFEIANNGTLFLDEIGDMSLVTQAKVLRVLEEKEFMRLGSNKIISSNVRIIAATNKDLKALIKKGKFRLDLYYRLNTLMFKIPPLRKRKGDIEELIKLFMESNNSNVDFMSDEVYNFLLNHSWNGNIRELKNCIDYMVSISISDGQIKMNHLPDYILEDVHTDICEQQDIFYLLNNYDQEILMDLMRSIAYSGGGRRRIYQQLKQIHPDLSEYKLRKLIDLLAENNLIVSQSGRTGMKLTDDGRIFLSSNDI